MSNVIDFCMDDSGPRHPDHNPGKRAKHNYDWFALGGMLVQNADEPIAREMLRSVPGGGTEGTSMDAFFWFSSYPFVS